MSQEKSSNDDPKIIVDDDWKTQVEKEKEDMQEKFEQTQQSPEMPKASFSVLVTTMATQALANLGQLPDPIEGKPVIRKPLAKHFIDTLAMLEEKTQGNLDAQESELLSTTLHQMRMIFVSAPDAMPETADQPAEKSSTIELP